MADRPLVFRDNAQGARVVDVECNKDPEHRGEVMYDTWVKSGGADCNPECGGRMKLAEPKS